MSHSIHLRSPWEFCEARGAVRIALPYWPTPEQCRAPVTLRRKFHRPTGLDDVLAVWLVVTETAGVACLWLNDEVLWTPKHADAECRVDVRQRLLPRNELRIELTAGTGFGDVTRLEIEEA